MLWFPYAKINLGLAVLNKGSDGFHNIESLFYPIHLFDILEIIESERDELLLTGLPLNITSDENLVWKVLQLLRKNYDFPTVKIHLHKQIPSGAGLGGGSSDAIHTLIGINNLFQLDINKGTMMKMALEIGSDCPFFLSQKAQYIKGKGEQLEDIELIMNPLKLILIVPDFTISTGWAYSKIEPKLPHILPKDALKQPIENWKNNLKNDFEKVVFAEFPVLADLKEKLYQSGAIYSSLSGSGSAMYGLFNEEIKIEIPKNFHYYWLKFGF